MYNMNKIVSKNNNKKIHKLPTINVIVFITLRFLVILSMVAQSIHGNWNNVFLCILTLILFTFPVLIKNKLNIELPKTLEIIIYLFIFASEILGEIQNFYGIFKHWDTLLHTLNGFLCAAVGFSLVDILNRKENNHISMTPIFIVIVSISFSMTIGVLWEFVEFGADRYLNKDMQKDRFITTINSKALGNVDNNELIKIDNIDKTIIVYDNNTKQYVINGYLDIGLIDTMKDLFVNFVGALVFSLLGFLYIKDRDEYNFVERFLPFMKNLKEE